MIPRTLLWMTFCATATYLAAAVAWGQAPNPAVTQANLPSTICARGWAATQRPPLAYTAPLKRAMLPPGARMQDYELDHIIPLEVGGHPTARANLQLQPWPQARAKDALEHHIHHEVCTGRLTLAQGQAMFRRDR